jgi:glycosyltransferase involved in cell wall biosynthesis
VIGRFAYAKGYRRLLDAGRVPPGVEYRPGVERAQTPRLFREVDVLVQPSECENFGSSVMEALGSGVPVITGPTNGTGEYASPTSFLFDEYTAESVFEAMRRAVAAVRSDREALARDARRTAEAHFRAEDVAGRLVNLVRRARAELYGQPGPGRSPLPAAPGWGA